MIGYSEGTDSQPDPYRVCFGYKHAIHDLVEHPAVSGEWLGEKLSDEMCRGAGQKPGCVSTAAGRYQMRKGTWIEARDALKLPDFSPSSQDSAALWLIERRAAAPGALTDIDEGYIGSAILKCRRIWASFPGANYAGQKERSLASLLAIYAQAGGQLAPG